MLKLTIKNEIFNRDLLVLANCSVQEADKYLTKIGSKHFIGDEQRARVKVAGKLIPTTADYYNCAYVAKLDKKIENQGTLIHELFHFIVRLCEDKGVPIISNIQTGEVGDETAAYLMNYYYEAIMSKVK